MTKQDFKDIIEYINANVKLLDVIDGYGLKVDKESDSRSTMMCPFHDENTASLKIFDNKTFFCYGCGAGYDVLEFIKMYERISFMDVINRYKQNVSTTGETIYQKVLNQSKGHEFDLAAYMMSSKFRLGLILREYLKEHPDKVEFVDSCFFEMDSFFEMVDNLDKERIDYFESDLLKRINDEL